MTVFQENNYIVFLKHYIITGLNRETKYTGKHKR